MMERSSCVPVGLVDPLQARWELARGEVCKSKDKVTQVASDLLWHVTEAVTAAVTGHALAELGERVEEEDISIYGAAPFALVFATSQFWFSVMNNQRGLRLSRPAVLAPILALFPNGRWLISSTLNFSAAAAASLVKSYTALLGSRDYVFGPQFCSSWSECGRVADVFFRRSRSYRVLRLERESSYSRMRVFACALRFDFLPVFVTLGEEDLRLQREIKEMSNEEFLQFLREGSDLLRHRTELTIPHDAKLTPPSFSAEVSATAKQCARRILTWGAVFFATNIVTQDAISRVSGD